MTQFLNVQDCVAKIKSNDNVFIQSVAATPTLLEKALVDSRERLKNVNIYHIHTEGSAHYANEKYAENFTVHSFFNGSNLREEMGERIAESYVPIFLSEIPHLFYNDHVKLDVALIQVSPPDEHGYCSLGPSVDVTIAAVRTAKLVIAQINKQMPRTFGEQISLDEIDYAIEVDIPLHELKCKQLSEVEKKIGSNIATLIDDGATLQMGIGSIPNAVLKCLDNHKDLGIHTEMFSDGIIPLIKNGNITGKHKVKHPYKVVTSFAHGSKELYDFINNNPNILFLDCSYTNNPHVIAQNPKVVAINSATEVDLTGQVCADSIGARIYSGVGGQMDFMRGAALSKGGKPIIALPSLTAKGQSKISCTLKSGAGVVTTRAHAHYIVTENGIAYLHGKTIKERAKELIKISSKDHQESLAKQLFEIYKISI